MEKVLFLLSFLVLLSIYDFYIMLAAGLYLCFFKFNASQKAFVFCSSGFILIVFFTKQNT